MKLWLNRGHYPMFQLFFRLRQMFHVGEKNIPENSHKVDVQHPESSRDKKEGDCEEGCSEDLVGKNLLPDDCCSLARQLLVKCFVPIVMWRTLAQTDRKHPHLPLIIMILCPRFLLNQVTQNKETPTRQSVC